MRINPRNSVPIAALLLLATCISEKNIRSESVDRAFAQKVAATVGAGQFDRTARFMHYPPTETPKQRESDEAGVKELLRLAEQKFGAVSVIASEPVVPNSVFLSVGAGTVEYWSEHPGFRRYSWRVAYTRLGQGWLFVDVANTGSAAGLRSLSFAIPRNAENASLVAQWLREGAERIRSASPN
jgi:hypothetical protein